MTSEFDVSVRDSRPPHGAVDNPQAVGFFLGEEIVEELIAQHHLRMTVARGNTAPAPSLNSPKSLLTQDARVEYFNTRFGRKASVDISRSSLPSVLLSILKIKISQNRVSQQCQLLYR